MQNLVDHVLQPTVGNYFRNSAQEVTVLDFLSARSERQTEAFEHIRKAIEAYDVECIDTLIGDIKPPAELMKTQTDRKIAEELERTYDVQREAQVKRQALERETAVAEHAERGRAHRSRWCASRSRTRWRRPKSAKGEANATRLRAEGQAAAVRLNGEAEAAAIRAVGAAKAEAYRQGIDAVGAGGLHRDAAGDDPRREQREARARTSPSAATAAAARRPRRWSRDCSSRRRRRSQASSRRGRCLRFKERAGGAHPGR